MIFHVFLTVKKTVFKNTMIFHVFLTVKKTVFKNTMIFHAFLNFFFIVPKKSYFFLAMSIYQSKVDPPAGAIRRVAARHGAFRGDPELNVGALPKPIYTRARINDWRQQVPPQLPQIINMVIIIMIMNIMNIIIIIIMIIIIMIIIIIKE